MSERPSTEHVCTLVGGAAQLAFAFRGPTLPYPTITPRMHGARPSTHGLLFWGMAGPSCRQAGRQGEAHLPGTAVARALRRACAPVHV